MKKIISIFVTLLIVISGFITLLSSAHDLPSEWSGDFREFNGYIQPNDIQQIVRNKCKYPLENNMMENVKILYEWVCDNINYKSDGSTYGVDDYWQLPSTTASKGTGDCEDQAILLTSLLRAAGIPKDSVHMVVGHVNNNKGHAWVEIKESTGIQPNLVDMPGIKKWMGKKAVLHTDDGDIYSEFTTENLNLVQTTGLGERNGWVPLDTTMILIDVFGLHVNVPFNFWMWFGYGNYLLFNLDIDMESLEFLEGETGVSVYTSKGYYPPGDELTFGIENNGEETIRILECYVEKKVGTAWEKVYASVISYEGIVASGNKQEWSWNQVQSNGSNAEAGKYCIAIKYNIGDNWELSKGYALFSICSDNRIPIPSPPESLYISTDKETYTSEESVSITVNNIGSGSLSLKKWYVEKRALSGIWEMTYESSRFFDYTILPVSDLSIEWNISDLEISVPIDTNWTEGNTLVGDFWNTTIEYNPGDRLIWNYPGEGGGYLGNVTFGLPDEPMVWQGTVTMPDPISPKIPWSPPIVPVTMLQPNQKLTWSWSQITSDGEKTGFGEYRIKVEYDDKCATTLPFSITVVMELPEHPIIWEPSINFTYSLATDLSIGGLNICETPSFVYNFSSTIPNIETIVNTDLKPLKVNIMSDVSTGRITVEVNNVVATTIKPLTIDNSNLLMSTLSGYKNVKIMPDMAKEKAGLKSVKNMELKEINNKPVYQVNGVRESTLLWFIPVDMDVTVHIDAKTGSEEKIEEPWWSFLTT